MDKAVNPKQDPKTGTVAMPTTGSSSNPSSPGAETGAEGGAWFEPRPHGSGKGSMKIRRTSSSKAMTKSKSSGSLKKKTEGKSGKNMEQTESAGGEVRRECGVSLCCAYQWTRCEDKSVRNFPRGRILEKGGGGLSKTAVPLYVEVISCVCVFFLWTMFESLGLVLLVEI